MKASVCSKFTTLLVVVLAVCSTVFGQKTWPVSLKTATDSEYPNNNMIGFKSKIEGAFTHQSALISENAAGNFDFTILPGNAASDTLFVRNVNLLEFMPTVPTAVKHDSYLSFLAVMNQEWNRIQVRFGPKLFSTGGGAGREKSAISRVDIANNCLAKGLWEILTFTAENGNDLLYFQSWFDFPEDLYNQLFLKRNGIDIRRFDEMLKNYHHESAQTVDLNALRKVSGEKSVPFSVQNDGYYPLKGERETKLKNIVFPTAVNSINDLLSDKTTFATFAAPGQYTRADPRKTELSYFQNLQKAMLCETVSANSAASKTGELQLQFSDFARTKSLKFILGGLNFEKLPVLKIADLHKGWQRPMGIGNHSFYNGYDDLGAASSAQNAFFAVLLDENGKWLDSHNIGIDGILMFRDEADLSKVHALILAFERHAFVGHFVFDMPQTAPKPADSADKKLVFYGDFRARPLEHDWNVMTADGKILDPRTRMRVRLRFGFNYQYSKTMSFGARIRTGTANEQQSPHVTLGATESANLPIGLDRAFVKYSNRGLTAWTGKNTFPFYTVDDLFCTADFSPEGAFASYEWKAGSKLKITPAAAYFVLNSTGKSFRRDRSMKAVQAKANFKSGATEVSFSSGLFVMDSLGNTPDGTATFLVNYRESFSNLKITWNRGKLPVSVYGNLMHNFAMLGDPNMMENSLDNQKTGYSATLEIGGLAAAKNWQLAATWAHIEKYSVVDYYAQDDWMRWGFSGGAGGTRGSNYEGFELRAGYAFGPKFNLVARAYFIDGIAPNKTNATLETNNRFRLDLNIGF